MKPGVAGLHSPQGPWAEGCRKQGGAVSEALAGAFGTEKAAYST
jgi:hypothetical protein